MNPYAERTQEKMKEVLMAPEAAGPAVHYYMIRGGSDKKNITIWETGTVGGEYIKAYGHYHIDDLKETYWLLGGQGLVLLQMRKKGADGKWIDDEIEWAKAIFVKPGDVIAIPPFAGHLMVNVGKTWLTTADDSPFFPNAADSASMPKHADYEPVRKMKGFAYYVVEQNGNPAFVKNPLYKDIPEIEISYTA